MNAKLFLNGSVITNDYNDYNCVTNAEKGCKFVYVKLFSQILTSSIWLESDQTLRVWITLLAAMDQDGFAHFASIRNLAQYARVSDDDCQTAVNVLEAPDPDSSDDTNEGRRIERVPGGWMVLNSAKYRELGRESDRREKVRGYVQKHRDKVKSDVITSNQDVITSNHPVMKSNHMHMHMQKQKKNKKSKSVSKGESERDETPARIAPSAHRASTQISETLINNLKAKPIYEGIDVDRELGKAQTWCEANKRTCTHRFFINWLNRVDRPLTKVSAPAQSRVGAQSKPVAVENDRISDAEMIAAWVDLADAQGMKLDTLLSKGVSTGQLSKDDAAKILSASTV